MSERLQKLMSQWGIASRRKAEQMIVDGRVRLNGRIAELGEKASPDSDSIELDGIVINPIVPLQKLYILLHKPAGVVSTCTDPWNRRTVLDLLPTSLVNKTGIHPVGRLDADSTGALLLTNDGGMTFALTHPSHPIAKEYQVWVRGIPSELTLQRWRQGVMLSGKPTLPAKVSLVRSCNRQSLLQVTLYEGRNRQIRKVAELLGHPVIELHRISVGSIYLENLQEGQYRHLSSSELQFLLNQVQDRVGLRQGKFPYDSVGVRGREQ